MTIYHGNCQCGHVSFELHSAIAAEDFKPRSDAENCNFCHSNGGTWIADPNGLVILKTADKTSIKKSGSNAVEFHFCKLCNDMCYASFCAPNDAAKKVAVLRLHKIHELQGINFDIVKTDFRGEEKEIGYMRRLNNWTPVKPSMVI